jgi:hypothetical protein
MQGTILACQYSPPLSARACCPERLLQLCHWSVEAEVKQEQQLHLCLPQHCHVDSASPCIVLVCACDTPFVQLNRYNN